MRLRAADVALGLWRAKWLMLMIFTPLAALAVLLAMRAPVHATAEARLLTMLGEEHVFHTGDETLAPELREAVLAEAEILRSRAVIERVLSLFPLARVYPDIERGISGEAAFRAGVEALQSDLSVETPEGGPVLVVRYDNADPDVAAEVLNAMIGAYLNHRIAVLAPDAGVAGASEAGDGLAEAQGAMTTFLDEHGVTDFETALSRTQALNAAVAGRLLEAQAALEGADSAAGATRARLQAAEQEIDLFHEDTSGEVLRDLRIEREGVLAIYGEDSAVVRAIEDRITALEQAIEAGGEAYLRVRRGPNPVRQALETRLDALAADRAGRRQEVSVLEVQLADTEAELARLSGLAPQWRVLQRRLVEAERRQTRLAPAETVEEDARARPSPMGAVRILEPAQAPLETRSLMFPIGALGLALAAVAALFAGLVSAYSRKVFSTPASLGATTGLPVVAAIPLRG